MIGTPKQVATGDPLGQWRASPAEWAEANLWGLAEYINGRAFKPTDFSPTGLPVVKITELKYGNSPNTTFYSGEYDEKHLLQTGDLLFAWSGNPETSLDAFWWRGGNALLNQHVFRVIPHEGIDRTYLYYLLKFLRPTFVRTARDKATSMGHVKVTDLKRLIARVPRRSEQQAIAHILGPLDDKIEVNRRMNETLEAVARAIFKSWFVDFEPVRAKANGRQPVGMKAETMALFPNSLEESKLGKIPANWAVGPILTQAKLLSGGTPNTNRQEYWHGGVLWASAKDVSQCGQAFLIITERTITRKGLEESATRMIPAFCTVIVARGATTGRMALLGRQMAMNQTCYAVETATETPFTLYCRLRHRIDDLVHAAHGSVFDTITTSTFASSVFVLPPKPLLSAFENLVSPLFRRVLTGTEESRNLATLRDALLPRLLSGEIRAREAEKAVERVV